MSDFAHEAVTTPQSIPAQTRDQFKFRSLMIDGETKTVTVVYLLGEDVAGEFVQHGGKLVYVFRNEIDENGDPVPGEQWWDTFKTGQDIDGTPESMVRFGKMIKNALVYKGLID